MAFADQTALELRIMRKGYLVFLVLLGCLTGCVPVDSLNPLYSDRNVVFEPALLGKWARSNPDDGFVRFERGDGDAYRMVIMEKKSSGEAEEAIVEAHLVSLGGEKYLDVSPTEMKGAAEYWLHTDPARKGSRFEPALQQIGNGVYLEVLGPTPGKGYSQELQIKVRPAHWILKVSFNEKTLSLSFLDAQWVEDQIKKKLLQARHLEAASENSTGWVLSGPTSELQQFVVHHADDPGAFGGTETMGKVE